MGVSVREKVKGSGEWWIFINHQGRRKSRKVGNRGAAEEVAKKVEARLVLGDVGIVEKAPQGPTFKECAELWFALPHAWKNSTREEYNQKLEQYVLPKFGKWRIEKIRRKHVKALFDKLLSKGLSPSTVNTVRAVLSGVLNHAVESELIENNVASTVKIMGKKQKAFEGDPLTEEEAGRLLEFAKIFKAGFVFFSALLCALRTGMRIGEIQALQWGDVDFRGRFLEVRRSWRDRRLTDTKSKKRRRVDITPYLAETLKSLRTLQKRRALEQGRPFSDWVFAGRKGEIMCREWFRESFNKCLEKVELRRIRIQDLRHSYATIRLLKGHNLLDVSYQLGHSDIKITQKTYCHWIPSRFKNEVDELDGAHPAAPYTHPEREAV